MAEQHPHSSEELLSDALRRLRRSSPQGASPELQRVLVESFHHRHRRRRALRFALAVTVCLAVVSGLVWWQRMHRNTPEQITSNQRMDQQSFQARTLAFVALPGFALSVPGEELRILRVEMPISSLRILGAGVNDELSSREVVADVLIGTDGTPYAFRIIN